MSPSRRMTVAAALLALAATTLVACSKTSTVNGSGGLSGVGASGLPSGVASGLPSGLPAPGATKTKNGSGHGNSNPTSSTSPSLPPPSPSVSSSRIIIRHQSNFAITALGNCFWQLYYDAGNYNLEIGAQFKVTFVGVPPASSVPFVLTNSTGNDNSSGTEPIGTFNAELGTAVVANSPFPGKTVTLTGTIKPLARDSNAADNTASVTVNVPSTGLPQPPSTTPLPLPC